MTEIYRQGKVFKFACTNCGEVQITFIFARLPFQVTCQKCLKGYRIPLSPVTEDLLEDFRW